MSDLPTVHKPGLWVWRAILLELLRREAAGEKPASVAALSRAAGKSRRQAGNHVAAMEQAKLIEWDSRLGHHGSEVRLTPLGRLVARILSVGFN